VAEWRINIPYRHEDESLADVAGYAGALEGDDAGVARALALQAWLDDEARTVGELLQILSGSSPTERRARLDRARQAAGLKPIERVEAEERIEEASRLARARWAEYQGPRICAASDCNQMAVKEDGSLRFPNVKRWFCPDHEDQQTEEDRLPPGPQLVWTGAAWVERDPQLEEKERVRERSREALRESQRLEREAEAEEMRKAERARDERLERETRQQFGR
jgi:hypothetical protein